MDSWLLGKKKTENNVIESYGGYNERCCSFCQNVTAQLTYYFSHKGHFDINHNIFYHIINVCLTWVMVFNKLWLLCRIIHKTVPPQLLLFSAFWTSQIVGWHQCSLLIQEIVPLVVPKWLRRDPCFRNLIISLSMFYTVVRVKFYASNFLSGKESHHHNHPNNIHGNNDSKIPQTKVTSI